MASRFADMHKGASAVVLDTFGEAALHIPRRANQYGAPSIDQDRQSAPITVVLAQSPGIDKFTGNRQQVSDISGGSRVGVNASEIWVPKSVADALTGEIRQGDAIQFVGQAGSPIFSVVSPPTRNNLGDMRLLVAAEKQA